MAKLERTYNVPLRRSFVKTPKYKRAKKAVTTLRVFLNKHMKSDDVKLGQHLNEHLWKHGIKNPPHHVKVKAVKDDDGVVKAELEGFEFKETVKALEAEQEQGLAGKIADKIGGGKKAPVEKVEKAVEEAKETETKEESPKLKKETDVRAKKESPEAKVKAKETKTKKAVAKPKKAASKPSKKGSKATKKATPKKTTKKTAKAKQ